MLRLLLVTCLLATWASATLAAPVRNGDRRAVKPLQIDEQFGYVRRLVDIPMRDGARLRTVIGIPRGARNLGILLTRTPYGAEGQLDERPNSYASLPSIAASHDDPITLGGYIRVFQDVRGRHGSEGVFIMNAPLARTQFNPTATDESTDAYDTIEWLVKNVPESNGCVGVIGTSYDGFLPLMALVNPHPALKVAVPINPMVDGWRGDDFFHNGAFRQQMLFFIRAEMPGTSAMKWLTDRGDDYEYYLNGGSAGAIAQSQGMEPVGFWQKISRHPAYDSVWQEAAVDRILAKQPLKVPTMLVHSLWDQEDLYGAIAVYKVLEPKDTANDTVFLTIGPWNHSQSTEPDASNIGAIKWGSNTALWWRRNVLAPFLAHYLRSDAPPMDVAPVTAFQSGANEWQRLQHWAMPDADDAARLYLKSGGSLGFSPETGATSTADYISDPATPVSYQVRPIERVRHPGSTWVNWLVDDQRGVSGRPDVLTFVSEPLSEPLAIAGEPRVRLTASTSGTDSDWVVKLIDVYPEGLTGERDLAGYQLPVAMDIFRGRYREDLAVAKPLAPNVPLKYSFALPTVNHVFLPGHRLMVQIQSSWFPLYDRNPQQFIPNIFFAQPEDYVRAVQKVTVSGPDASYVSLPVVK